MNFGKDAEVEEDDYEDDFGMDANVNKSKSAKKDDWGMGGSISPKDDNKDPFNLNAGVSNKKKDDEWGMGGLNSLTQKRDEFGLPSLNSKIDRKTDDFGFPSLNSKP